MLQQKTYRVLNSIKISQWIRTIIELIFYSTLTMLMCIGFAMFMKEMGFVVLSLKEPLEKSVNEITSFVRESSASNTDCIDKAFILHGTGLGYRSFNDEGSGTLIRLSVFPPQTKGDKFDKILTNVFASDTADQNLKIFLNKIRNPFQSKVTLLAGTIGSGKSFFAKTYAKALILNGNTSPTVIISIPTMDFVKKLGWNSLLKIVNDKYLLSITTIWVFEEFDVYLTETDNLYYRFHSKSFTETLEALNFFEHNSKAYVFVTMNKLELVSKNYWVHPNVSDPSTINAANVAGLPVQQFLSPNQLNRLYSFSNVYLFLDLTKEKAKDMIIQFKTSNICDSNIADKLIESLENKTYSVREIALMLKEK